MKCSVSFKKLSPAYFSDLSRGAYFWIPANDGNPEKLDVKISDTEYCPAFSQQPPRWMNPNAAVIHIKLDILQSGQT